VQAQAMLKVARRRLEHALGHVPVGLDPGVGRLEDGRFGGVASAREAAGRETEHGGGAKLAQEVAAMRGVSHGRIVLLSPSAG